MTFWQNIRILGWLKAIQNKDYGVQTQITLDSEAQAIVAKLLSNGTFDSVELAANSLIKQSQPQRGSREWLKAALEEGENSGPPEPMDWDRINTEVNEMLANNTPTGKTVSHCRLSTKPIGNT